MTEIIKVVVELTAPGVVSVTSTHPIPSIRVLLPYFSRSQQKVIKDQGTYYELSRIISSSGHLISFQEWSDAIARATEKIIASKLPAVSEIVIPPASYLTLGEMVYKLSPVEVIQPTQAVRNAHQRILAESKLEGEVLVRDAQINAEALVQIANKKLLDAKRVLNEAAKQGSVYPPVWAVETERKLRFRNGVWNIGFTVDINLSYFDLQFTFNGQLINVSWRSLEHGYKTVGLWLPIHSDGGYTISSLYVDSLSSPLPHVSRTSACLSIGAGPSRIQTRSDFSILVDEITRALSRVQLDSLYTPLEVWVPGFEETFPNDLYQVLTYNWDWSNAVILAQHTKQMKDSEGVIWTTS